jgi:beta-glucosidase
MRASAYMHFAIHPSQPCSAVPSFADFLVELVEEGSVPEGRVDESAARIIQTKKLIGIMPQFGGNATLTAPDTIGQQADRDAALDMMRESLTLLENGGADGDKVLPFSIAPEDACSILLVGPIGDSIRMLAGGWTVAWQGSPTDDYFSYGTTILAGLTATMPSNCEIDFLPVLEPGEGFNFSEKTFDFISPTSLAEAVAAAEAATHVILAIGEETYTEKPGDIDDLRMDAAQLELMQAMNSIAVPGGVVNVLVEGRPRSLDRIMESEDFNMVNAAIVEAFLPGPDGGLPIAELIFGQINPSGRLPITYPKFPNNCMPYWHRVSEASTFNPQWEFGHGLSYTEWSYSDLALSTDSMDIESLADATVSVTVTNSGSMDGKHTVLMYVADDYRSITPEVKRLKGFEKVTLAAGESTEVTFTLSSDDLAFYNIDDVRVVEPGTFTISIDSTDLSATLAVVGDGQVCLNPDPSSSESSDGLTTAGTFGIVAGAVFGVGLAAAGIKQAFFKADGSEKDAATEQPLI